MSHNPLVRQVSSSSTLYIDTLTNFFSMSSFHRALSPTSVFSVNVWFVVNVASETVYSF